jgi:hypothetical protein
VATIYTSRRHLLCRMSSAQWVIINGASAGPPRKGIKEVMNPVRSDEDAQMVAPTRFASDSRSHSHIRIPDSRLGTAHPGQERISCEGRGMTQGIVHEWTHTTDKNLLSYPSPLSLQLPFPNLPLPSLLFPIPVLGGIFIFNPSILPHLPSCSFTHHSFCSLQLSCGYTELFDPAEERRKFRKEVHAV